MSAIRLHCDEDSQSRALIAALRTRGLEVTSTAETGLLGSTDEEQLAWAAREGRVVFTHNIDDFCRLHRKFLKEGKSHAGIIVAEQSLSIGTRLRGLLRLAQSFTAEEMRNRLEFFQT